MARIIDEPTLRNQTRVFNDRMHAGILLGDKLNEYHRGQNVYVLAIPAGGVPVAIQVAAKLGVQWDLVLTRKLHVPWNREAGFGAVAWDGSILINESLTASLRLTRNEIRQCIAEERAVITARLTAFRGKRPFPDLTEKTVIIVDDGVASGFSMLTTIVALKKQAITELVVAIPTAPSSAIERIRPHVTKIVCLNIRSGLSFAVADAYRIWYDLTDRDVLELLTSAGLLPSDRIQ
jgi:predicted phosphoribosyltransferase